MRIEVAIVLAALILGVSYVLGNLHKIEADASGRGVVLLNTVTGHMTFCSTAYVATCIPMSAKDAK